MAKKEKIILYDSPEAASLKTVKAWVSGNGSYIGKDERTARFRGSTHKKCECGEIISNLLFHCDECSEKIHFDNYEKLPFKEWDKKTPVCIFLENIYFWDIDGIECFLQENNIEPQDLRLVICEPLHYNHVDSDIFEDVLPENGGINPELLEKLKEFNLFIDTLKPASWIGSSVRTEYKR